MVKEKKITEITRKLDNARQKAKISNKKKARIAAIIASVLDIIILVVLVASLLNTNAKLAKANSKLNYLSDNTDILMSEVSNLHTEFGAMLEDEASLLENWSINVVDTNFNQGEYKVEVTVVPKEYTEKTKSAIYFGTTELKLKLDGFKYVGSTVLPLSQTYKDNVTVLFVDGNKRRTEQLKDFDGLYNDFDGILTAATKELPRYKKGMLKLSSPIDYELDGKSRFEFNSFDLVIEANGVEVNKFDVVASNGKDKDENISHPVIGTYVSNEDIPVAAGAEVRIYFRAVTKEGFRFEYDVFNGKTMKDDKDGFEESDQNFESNACVYDSRGGKLELQETK